MITDRATVRSALNVPRRASKVDATPLALLGHWIHEKIIYDCGEYAMNWLDALRTLLQKAINPPAAAEPISSRSGAIEIATEFIAKWEGCRLAAYLDEAKIPTIAYGRTTNVRMGDTCTQEQADAWLEEEVEQFRRGVRGAVLVPLNDNQLAALTSFAYNCGLAAFRGSTLLRKLNMGDYQGAADQFPVWNRAGNRVVQGLINRRAAERALFLKDSQ